MRLLNNINVLHQKAPLETLNSSHNGFVVTEVTGMLHLFVNDIILLPS